MRSGLLSDKEKKIIAQYLQDGTKLDGFRMLLSRCKKFLTPINEDLETIEKFVKTVEAKG